jgi:O-antigen/teichoic acid export membrane protein
LSSAPRSYRTRRMRFDVFVTVGGKVLFVALGALTTVLIARHLGPTGQGVFAVSFNLTLILVQLGSSGLSVAAPTLVARWYWRFAAACC